MRMSQIRNSQAGWNKYKCNNSFQQQRLHILGMMKWMINGNESVKIFKTLLISCVLGKYDVCYSFFQLFCGSYEIVELDFPFVNNSVWFLNLRNSNNETYQTLHTGFLNYLLIAKGRVRDLCIIIIIIIIISFSIFFTCHTMPNNWKKN